MDEQQFWPQPHGYNLETHSPIPSIETNDAIKTENGSAPFWKLHEEPISPSGGLFGHFDTNALINVRCDKNLALIKDTKFIPRHGKGSKLMVLVAFQLGALIQ